MKIYIAGAITDNPNYKEQFKAAEERLTAEGWQVINPANNQGYTYKEYIDVGLFELMHCDAIYLLDGYDKSTGATLEHDYARTVGLEIIKEDEKDWDRAVANVNTCMEIALSIYTPSMNFYIITCKSYLKRYEYGERTQSLYEEMMGVH